MSRMIKNIFAMALIASAAHAATAATVSAPASATFDVTNTCSVTGSTVNLGTYSTGQTAFAIAQMNGYSDGDSGYTWVPGSAASDKTLATVNCSVGLPYNLKIAGGGAFGAFRFFSLPFDFNVTPLVFAIDGASVGAQPIDIKWGYGNTGNGQDQVYTGTYGVIYWGGTGGAAATFGANALPSGTFTATGTASVTF